MSKSHLCTVEASNFSLSKLLLLQCVWHGYQGRMKIWVSKVQCTNKSYSKMSKSMQVPLYFSTFLLAVFHSANYCCYNVCCMDARGAWRFECPKYNVLISVTPKWVKVSKSRSTFLLLVTHSANYHCYMKTWVSKVQCINTSCSKTNKNIQMTLYLVLSNFFDILSLYIMSCWGCIKTQMPLYLILECPKYTYVL